MSARLTIAGRADWLAQPELQAILAALSADGECARIAGGAVRNALLGEPVNDIDIATTTLPEETIRRAAAAGFRTVPTGIEHGTVTIIAGGHGYETTTLRADLETDGRRATVAFGRDWAEDAARRDFTINALYADTDGSVIDLVGGVADIESRTLRFIGDPEDRIREDYLRILRFFRFFAQYGHGRPDAAGLKACARMKDGLARLSAERVWSELKKTLAAADPSRALLWMRQTGVLSTVLPESANWGIDAIHGLAMADKALAREPDAMLRLEAIVPPESPRMEMLAARLRLSNAECQRLRDWAFTPLPPAEADDKVIAEALYRGLQTGVSDRLALAHASASARAEDDPKALREAAQRLRHVRLASDWTKPVFPVSGADLMAAGLQPGPALGAELKRLEEAWIASTFTLPRETLLGMASND